MKAKKIQDLLEDVLCTFEGEAEVLIAGVYEILGTDLEDALLFIDKEMFFNFYQDIDTYVALASQIGYDKVLWEDVDLDTYRLEERAWYQNIEDEEKAKEKLQADGWSIASNGLAIGLVEDYLTQIKQLKLSA